MGSAAGVGCWVHLLGSPRRHHNHGAQAAVPYGQCVEPLVCWSPVSQGQAVRLGVNGLSPAEASQKGKRSGDGRGIQKKTAAGKRAHEGFFFAVDNLARALNSSSQKNREHTLTLARPAKVDPRQ